MFPQAPIVAEGPELGTQDNMPRTPLTWTARSYMWAVIAAGVACLLYALATLPYEKLDATFGVIAVCTIGLSSRITVKIPRFNSHVSVSDVFVFLTLLVYGGETAVVLAAVEAFTSASRFCTRRLTVWFNAAAMAVSTMLVVAVLRLFDLYSEAQLHGHDGHGADFLIAISLMVLTQFLANTLFASLYDLTKSSLPLWETWKNKYIWVFCTYLIGAFGAGLIVRLMDSVGFGVIFAAVPIIFFVFASYRIYLNNIEMSADQAEKAKEHAAAIEERTVALRESEQRFRNAFNYAPIGIALVSGSGRWLKVNHALTDILGYNDDEFRQSDFQSMIYPDDLAVALRKIASITAGEIANCQIEQRYVHKNGEIVWTLWSVSSAGGATPETSNLIFQIQDISSRKQAEEKLQYEATHDALTGLPNRAYFLTRLTEALQRSHREADHNVSVLFIDLDRFKYVNDSLGHVAGDRLLVGISRRLRECMRPGDTVARLGGDEFTILVEGDHDGSEVILIADRIQEQFSIPFEIGEHEIFSSASIGILHASEHHLTAEDMMRDADTAMYRAKRSGKARHEVFDRAMHTEARETLRLETDLRRAIERNEFSLMYQPIISLESGDVVSVEALARWEHPELGVLPPSKFISVAEEIGRIDDLGELILRMACLEMRALCADDDAGIRLSVNLSSRQFANERLVDCIRTVLEETHFPPGRLKLEITESVFCEYQEGAIAMLRELLTIGIETDIDDFGTGYSNLGYLVRLPISTLKIDRSFIAEMLDSDANREVVKTVIALARNLGLRVIGEGIETEQQLEALRALGCESGQGFLFAPPMRAGELHEFLLRNSTMPPATLNDISILPTLQ